MPLGIFLMSTYQEGSVLTSTDPPNIIDVPKRDTPLMPLNACLIAILQFFGLPRETMDDVYNCLFMPKNRTRDLESTLDLRKKRLIDRDTQLVKVQEGLLSGTESCNEESRCVNIKHFKHPLLINFEACRQPFKPRDLADKVGIIKV